MYYYNRRYQDVFMTTMKRRGVKDIRVIDEGEYNGERVDLLQMTGPNGEQVFMTCGAAETKDAELGILFRAEAVLDEAAITVIRNMFCNALTEAMETLDKGLFCEGDMLETSQPFFKRFGYGQLVFRRMDHVVYDGNTHELLMAVAMDDEEADSVVLIERYIEHAVKSGIAETDLLFVDAPRERFIDTIEYHR